MDDRSQPIKLHAHDLPRRAPKQLRKLASKAELSFSGDLHWTEVAFLVLGLVLQATLGVALQQWMQRAGWSSLNQSIALGTLFGVTITMFYGIPFVSSSVMRERSRRAITAWAEAGLCPACGHDIALDLEKNELTQSEDGYATCPQCQAAWQVERFETAKQAHGKDWRRQWEESQYPKTH